MRGRQPRREHVGERHVPRACALGAVRPEGPARIARRRRRAAFFFTLRRRHRPEALDALERQKRDAPVPRAVAHVHERERAARAPHQRELGPGRFRRGRVRPRLRLELRGEPRELRDRRDVQNRAFGARPDGGATRFAQRRARAAAQARRARDCHLVQHRLGRRRARRPARAGRGGTRGERDEQEIPVRARGERRGGQRRVQQRGRSVQVVLRVNAKRVRRRIAERVVLLIAVDRSAFRIRVRRPERLVVVVVVAVSAPGGSEPVEPPASAFSAARLGPRRLFPRRRLDGDRHDVAHPRGGDGDERLLLRHCLLYTSPSPRDRG